MIANPLPLPLPPSTPRPLPLPSPTRAPLPSLALLPRFASTSVRRAASFLSLLLPRRCIISSIPPVFLSVLLGEPVLARLSVMAQLLFVGSNERLLDAPMPLADAGMEELIAPRSNRGAISAICNLTVTRWLRGGGGRGGQNKLLNRNFRDGRSDDGAKCGITEFEYPYIRTRVHIRGRGVGWGNG